MRLMKGLKKKKKVKSEGQTSGKKSPLQPFADAADEQCASSSSNTALTHFEMKD